METIDISLRNCLPTLQREDRSLLSLDSISRLTFTTPNRRYLMDASFQGRETIEGSSGYFV